MLDCRKTKALEQVFLCRCWAKDCVERERLHSHSGHLFMSQRICAKISHVRWYDGGQEEQTDGVTTESAVHWRGGSVAVSEPRSGLTRRQTFRELLGEEASIERVRR